MATWASRNEQSFWVSALTNHTLIHLLQVDLGRESMHILAERLAAARFNIPQGRLSTSIMPVHNPQDDSPWPELLGWLVKVGTMTEVCERCNEAPCACGSPQFEKFVDSELKRQKSEVA